MAKVKQTPNKPFSRKDRRKQERKEKKARKCEYYMKRSAKSASNSGTNKEQKSKKSKQNVQPRSTVSVLEIARQKEKREQKKLQDEMTKQRSLRLQEANEEEDRTIKKLEKQLKLKKRDSKSIPKSFALDGLDYVLEACDSKKFRSSVLAEQNLNEIANEDFQEDLALMTGHKSADDDDDDDDSDMSELEEEAMTGKMKDDSAEEMDIDINESEKDSDSESELSDHSESELSEDSDGEKKSDVWEDIYGRLRNKDGSVVEKVDKYVPPAARTTVGEGVDNDKLEALRTLKRQLKGLLNRLTESNMHFISTQIETLYMNNSRNDMNTTLTDLMLQTLATDILTPERLLLEHAVLIAVLHANVGTEVGAYFMQTVVKRFDATLKNHHHNCDNKSLLNLVNIVAQIYNFKMCDCKLIYDIIGLLYEKFTESTIECILSILRNVGFMLRKDDPAALKKIILDVQQKASSISDDDDDNARVKYMLDIFLAIKNNNVKKIPNYDVTYADHLKKIMKGFIRKGNYATQLNISVEELLTADDRGRWWIVGSAWKGKDLDVDKNQKNETVTTYSSKLINLARKNKMNTDTRKSIFCIIMSAEDYLDAFEKLLRLGLKNQQEREIIHVLLHCCLQEKTYNPYYSVLAQKFCEFDRRFQMIIKYAIWDKLKALNDHSGNLISNLAKLLIHLFLNKGLSLSVLKVVEFGELDQISLRFIRQILLGVLVHPDVDQVQEVFERVSKGDKLKMFRQSLRLFIHHFLLKNLKTVPDKEVIEARVKIVDKLLKSKEINF